MSKPTKIINNDYEIHDVTKYRLQYVILRGEGMKKIASHYQEKYGVKIEIVEHYDLSEESQEENLYNKINEIGESLQNEEAQGLVFISKLPEQSYTNCHANPYIIAKSNNKIIVVNFQNTGFDILKNWMRERSKENEFTFLYVQNFDNQVRPSEIIKMQKDLLLCGTFAVDVLKQSLLDENLLNEVLNFEPEIYLSKVKLGQGLDFLDQLNEEEQFKYVKMTPYHTNLAAWYKAHAYARKLNPTHMNELEMPTRKMIESIDQSRREYKKIQMLSSSPLDDKDSARII